MINLTIDPADFAATGDKPFSIADARTLIEALYAGKKDYREQLEAYREELDELQRMMYAHDRYAMLAVFQAMDAAGKDGTIRNVFSGVNPHGLQLFAFKQPSDTELDHDFMWRTNLRMPERGRIGVFNRSYYEEVLVVRVHPEILTSKQRLPVKLTGNPARVWEQRYEDIRHFELYAHRNGIQVLKFFLNVSREEQTRRFISRIDEPEKNWKFSAADAAERQHWDAYMQAYQSCINATGTPHAPWYVIPADDKRNMRLIVAQVVLHQLRALDIHYPKVGAARRNELQKMKKQLEA
jgi:PPK2 family polyphosphate:nucleotide phosphotransferase